MDTLDLVLQVIAYGASLIGIFLMAKRPILGLSIQSAAFFPWALVSYLHGLPLMIAFDAVLALLDIRAILTWDRQRRSTLSIGPPGP